MEHYITCPNCKRTISNNPIIDEAATRAGSSSRSVICECGERITYWAITDQLRKQTKLGPRIQKWFRSRSAAQH